MHDPYEDHEDDIVVQENLSTSAWVGIGVGAFIAIVLIAIAVYWFRSNPSEQSVEPLVAAVTAATPSKFARQNARSGYDAV